MNSEIERINEESLKAYENIGLFSVVPCESNIDINDPNRFTRIQLSPLQKMQISAFMQSVPLAIAGGLMSNAYSVSFPKGLPHTLTALKQGGVSSLIQVDGKFAGSASFYSMSAQATILGAFTAMSVATGQYFMAQINSRLDFLNRKMDDILSFLYGDKKAELLAEISFVKYALENFASIMSHDFQRIATIGNLQAAKKIAMKDIEFYLVDLEIKSKEKERSFSGLEELINTSFQIRNSLELSIQLYIMSSLLEMQFAQNDDESFIAYLEHDMKNYIRKCEKQILTAFGRLESTLDSYKAKPMEKIDKTPYQQQIESLRNALDSVEDSEMEKTINKALHAFEHADKCYITPSGDVYLTKHL